MFTELVGQATRRAHMPAVVLVGMNTACTASGPVRDDAQSNDFL